MSLLGVVQAKAILRKQLKQRLASMTDESRLEQSQYIAQKLFSLPEYQSSKRVCVYLNMKEEVQTLSIVKNILDNNKTCFIPQYIGPIMKMVPLKSWLDYETLPETKWKIKQPADDDDRPDALDTGGLDLILIPGLGFTRFGDRIGRGKGYYDNYIKKCTERGSRPYTIALAYREQIVDEVPMTPDDKKIDHVLHMEGNTSS